MRSVRAQVDNRYQWSWHSADGGSVIHCSLCRHPCAPRLDRHSKGQRDLRVMSRLLPPDSAGSLEPGGRKSIGDPWSARTEQEKMIPPSGGQKLWDKRRNETQN